MIEWLIWLVSQEWFMPTIVAPLLGWLFDRLFKARRDLKGHVAQLMLAAQKIYPDLSGEEKKKMVVEWLNEKNPLAKRLPDVHLEKLIDLVVDDLKEAVDG
jgi:hypothetical protein